MKRAWTFCGAALVAISISLVPAADAAHPGGNGLITFVAGDSIYAVYPDGSHKRELRFPEQPTFRLSSPAHPTWSPDGTKIAFVALRTPLSGEADNDLFVMNADGSELRLLAEAARAAVSWSPNGSEIAFTHFYTANGSQRRYVAVVGADGHGGRIITGAESFDPAWSPDGRTIVFGSEPPALETVNPDGTGRRILIPGLAARPDWSPDGSKLLFDNGHPENGEIYTVNADGSGMHHIASGGYAAVWSPDGTKIVFTTSDSLIKYLRPDGTSHDLGRATVDGEMPDWQPCGRGVRCPMTAICVVPRVTGLSLNRARVAIRRAGCSVGKIGHPRNVMAAKAIVARQFPRAGMRLGHGAKVNLVLRQKR